MAKTSSSFVQNYGLEPGIRQCVVKIDVNEHIRIQRSKDIASSKWGQQNIVPTSMRWIVVSLVFLV